MSVETKPDFVNHPSHYTEGPIESIDAIASSVGRDGMIAHCKANAIKYLWRAGKKDNTVQDLEKAKWYINKMIEVLNAEV